MLVVRGKGSWEGGKGELVWILLLSFLRPPPSSKTSFLAYSTLESILHFSGRRAFSRARTIQNLSSFTPKLYLPSSSSPPVPSPSPPALLTMDPSDYDREGNFLFLALSSSSRDHCRLRGCSLARPPTSSQKKRCRGPLHLAVRRSGEGTPFPLHLEPYNF